ncbi:fatty acyl-CoA reductase 1-like [Frankliniella occidentalis]|uniref:Fatty acyl-CoA reductase n=1 Tax=Frankliniella occidentalis TaxID=133901 RepID=A0A9C6X170_FRAOC|nr:fatty acyl-CoA reductase 1-like [Frankliniella occidentalis]
MLKVFENIRRTDPGALAKIVPINGDCFEKRLGLSPDDASMVQAEVNVFVHTAASVRFDDPVKQAVLLNTRGAQEVCSLALGMPHLRALVHVSTTYSNTNHPIIEERVYPATAKWREMVHLAETLTEEDFQRQAPQHMGYHPNTYTFTKSLAEQVVNDHRDRLNVAIYRPSIVVGAMKEPMPGWVDNLNGPMALCVGVSKGLIHTALADENSVMDMVPVDIAVNGIILAVYETMRNSTRGEIKVFNGCSSNKKTLKVQEIMDLGLKCIEKNPHDRILWYPFVFVTSSKVMFTILTCIFHFFPALIVDTITRLTGNKPWMWRTYMKAYKATLAIRYFTLHHWVFRNEKFFELEQNLNERDAATYKLDQSKEVDIPAFIALSMEGVRRYVLKENMDPVKAKRNQMTMYIIDRVVRGLLLYFAVTSTYGFISGLVG